MTDTISNVPARAAAIRLDDSNFAETHARPFPAKARLALSVGMKLPKGTLVGPHARGHGGRGRRQRARSACRDHPEELEPAAPRILGRHHRRAEILHGRRLGKPRRHGLFSNSSSSTKTRARRSPACQLAA